jgi:hypothetical protein
MESNRVLGQDDIPTEFYQHCWEVVKNDVMNIFYSFHNGSMNLQQLNYGVIILLPKMADVNKIHQYRWLLPI